MARFKVRAGKTVSRHGRVHVEGEEIDLEPHVAADQAVAHAIESVVTVDRERVAAVFKAAGESAKKAAADVKALITAPQTDTQE